MSRSARPWILAGVSLGVSLLLVEGVLSAFFGLSWRTLLRRSGDGDPLEHLASDRDVFRAATTTPGPYRVTEDPLVGYAFKVNSSVRYLEGQVESDIQTDALGLRRRPGAPPAPDAFRIVVLGDSVAFGHGLADDETLAVQLEGVLRAAVASQREIACLSVAVPSWNYRNSFRFLLDHLDAIDPDLVLYIPVHNDLNDSYTANEAGQRRTLEDPGVPHPLLHFQPEQAFQEVVRRTQKKAPGSFEEGRLGPDVLDAGLTESSSWRIRDMASVLAHAQERLARAGTVLVLVPYKQSNVHREARAELVRRGVAIPVIPLLERMEKEDQIPDDPHPSADTVRAFALWIAAALLEHPWLPGKLGQPLSEVDARYAGRRTRELTDEELLAWSRERRATNEAALEAVISTTTLRGTCQIYGGLNLDGSLEPVFACVLPHGKRLSLRLAPLEARPDLYPLELAVFVNERRLGALTVGGAGESTQAFELGPDEARAPFEVRLEAQDWASVTVLGRSWVAAAKLLELASLDE